MPNVLTRFSVLISEIGGADELALAHQDAARHLRQELAGADAHQQLLDLAQPALLAHPLRIGGKLANRRRPPMRIRCRAPVAESRPPERADH